MKTRFQKESTLRGLNSKILVVLNVFIFLSMSACGEDAISVDENDETTDSSAVLTYPIVETNQTTFYDASNEISEPSVGEDFYGQDASYSGNAISYTDNGDGTITDNVTNLMWAKSPDLNSNGEINYDDKLSYDAAVSYAETFDLAGYSDWRLPTIKELYSLIIFSGLDVAPMSSTSSVPFIDEEYFDFAYGDTDAGERIIDAQFATTTLDVGDSEFGGGNLMFGVNFADGRIKGYPTGPMPGQTSGKKFYVFYVRGGENYGENNLQDNGDGTITDVSTGLMWMKEDSGEGINWEEALNYAESRDFAGYTDWRLPNIKELQSIVDYSRAPGATNSAAIDPLFDCTQIQNEAGLPDFPYFWSGTTHASVRSAESAAYVSFGRAMGYFNGEWQDVHGAGAQRSDPKTGSSDDYPYGFGPQGDAIRINNFVRLVRNVNE